MRRAFIRLLLIPVIAGLALAGCAGHIPPNAAPETKIAIYGADVMTGTREVQRMTLALEAGRIITESQTAWVMGKAYKIGQGGELLAKALAIYHAAADLAKKNIALAEVYRILDQIEADVKDLLKPIDAAGTKAQYVEVVTGIIKSLFSVRLLLPVMGGV